MNKSERRFVYIFAAFAAILLLTGSLADFAIGKAMIDQNSIYGYIFQVFGMFPQALIPMIAGGVIVAYGLRQKHPLLKCLLSLSGIGFAYWSVWGGVDIAMGYIAQSLVNIKQHKPLGVASNGIGGETASYSFSLEALITLILTIIGLAIIFYWLRNKTDEDFKILLTVAIAGIAIVYLSNDTVNTMKINWGRFRPYEVQGVLAGSQGYFTNWWHLNGADGHQSFPSGHTIAATAILTLPFFVDRKNIKWQRILSYAGLVYIALLILARIRIGAHWLTDTTLSLIIGGIITFVGMKVLGFAYIEEEK